ncbi:unnamed protein product [Cyprideis torosa]|uniref:Uncharacterized protein n=1 Tax=Cyprideis torosa TaxID=163714 RepID=A0A7R8ZTS0_9CRUS|nr:unnamed protein product [Cyprideis torosa]CAG0898755.1 unnamed protein product [Cyprideis torosa]
MFLFLILILAISSSSNAKTCDLPFEETPGGKCLFNPMELIQATWDQGQRICRWIHENGHLVEFQSYEEMLDVTGYLNERYGSCSNWPSGGVWIGAVEVADTNEFIWQSTNSTVVVANWIQGQPNSPTSGDAAMMNCEFLSYWIGAEERGTNQYYEWASSGKTVFVTNWWYGYSPDSGTDDTIVLAAGIHKYRWEDAPRTFSYYELCEADPADLS